MDFIESLFSQNSLISIINSIIAAALIGIFTFLIRNRHKPNTKDSNIETRLINKQKVVYEETEKERQLRHLKSKCGTAFYYGFTVYICYAAITLPLMLKSLGMNPINLQMARHIGTILPDYTVSGSLFQPVLLAISLLCYIAIIWLSIIIGNAVGNVVDKYIDLTIRKLRLIWLLFVCLFASLLSITVIWLYGNISFQDAAFTFLAFMLLIIVLGMSNEKRA